MSRLDAGPSEASGWDVAALLIAMLPIGVIGVVCLLGLLGVNNNQGKTYVFFYPLGSLMLCTPVAMLSLAIGGAFSRRSQTRGPIRLLAAGWILFVVVLLLVFLGNYFSIHFGR